MTQQLICTVQPALAAPGGAATAAFLTCSTDRSPPWPPPNRRPHHGLKPRPAPLQVSKKLAQAQKDSTKARTKLAAIKAKSEIWLLLVAKLVVTAKPLIDYNPIMVTPLQESLWKVVEPPRAIIDSLAETLRATGADLEAIVSGEPPPSPESKSTASHRKSSVRKSVRSSSVSILDMAVVADEAAAAEAAAAEAAAIAAAAAEPEPEPMPWEDGFGRRTSTAGSQGKPGTAGSLGGNKPGTAGSQGVASEVAPPTPGYERKLRLEAEATSAELTKELSELKEEAEVLRQKCTIFEKDLRAANAALMTGSMRLKEEAQAAAQAAAQAQVAQVCARAVGAHHAGRHATPVPTHPPHSRPSSPSSASSLSRRLRCDPIALVGHERRQMAVAAPRTGSGPPSAVASARPPNRCRPGPRTPTFAPPSTRSLLRILRDHPRSPPPLTLLLTRRTLARLRLRSSSRSKWRRRVPSSRRA